MHVFVNLVTYVGALGAFLVRISNRQQWSQHITMVRGEGEMG